jgi:murein DD-endopeptidase MepM/ murein hydrolase activator NlpD
MMWRTLLAVAAIATSACAAAPEAPRPSLQDTPTHERYAAALTEFGLDRVALGRDWLHAAQRALAQPRSATMPFAETGYLAADRPSAVAFRLDLVRGRRLAIDVQFESAEPSRLFVDLFEQREGREPRRVGGSEPGATSFEFDVRRAGQYVLRLQPELLRGGRYTVTQRTLASLKAPIEGFIPRQVQSGFGAPRDGGARDHHGIDIFVPRGTPVLASADGVVRVDETPRGGRVVWLRDARGGRNVYYAHLHDWAVSSGAQVRIGDVLGYVGNTGNARTTPPHLHFGVYDRGPADPVPFLQRDDPVPSHATAALDPLGTWMRVQAGSTSLRTHDATHDAGSMTPGSLTPLDRGAVVRVLAASGSHYRVELPDGRSGLVLAADLASAEAGQDVAAFSGDVLEAPAVDAPIVDVFREPRDLPVLGQFGEFSLIQLPDFRLGWAVRRP